MTNQGNVVVETGAQQIVSVAGDYNAIDLGPYDDVVVVSGYGNTINAGGGVNTIIIQPPPPDSSRTIQPGPTVVQEQPMSASMVTVQASGLPAALTTAVTQTTGNTIVLP